jgi:hypothetical protein
MRDICAVNFIETAKPALSSAGEVIFDPEDNRASDWLRLLEDCMSNDEAFIAARLVLMTITYSFRESPREGHLICATSMLRVLQLRAKHRLSPPALLAAGLQSCDTQAIGANPPDLNHRCKIFIAPVN